MSQTIETGAESPALSGAWRLPFAWLPWPCAQQPVPLLRLVQFAGAAASGRQPEYTLARKRAEVCKAPESHIT